MNPRQRTADHVETLCLGQMEERKLTRLSSKGYYSRRHRGTTGSRGDLG